MGRVRVTRPVVSMAVMALLASALVAIGAPPALAASEGQHASAWSSPDPVLWFPLPPGSTNPLGAPNDTCVEGSSSPGGAIAFFTFPAFSIPPGDVIQGVEVKPKYRTNDTHFIQLTSGGAVTGTEKTLPLNYPGQSYCSSTSIVSVGGASDLWGAGGLTPADFNAGSIGVRIREKVAGEGSVPLSLDSIELIVHHGSANSAPTAEADGPYSVPEGSSVGLSSAGSTDPDGDPLTIDWDLDDNGSFETSGASPTFSAAGRNGPDSQTVVVRVSDGSLSDTDTATVNITNVAPTIGSISLDSASISEGGSVTVSGTFSDPGTGETYTGSALWSDGVSTAVSVAAGTFSTSRTFADDHPATGTASDTFSVDVTIDDGDGGSDTATSPTLTVSNVSPSISSIGVSNASIDEGGSVTVSGTFSDPALGEGTETFSGTAVWSDGASTAITVGAGSFSTSRTFPDDDPTATPFDDFTVDVTITDDDTGSDTATSPTVTVANVDPVITTLTSSATFADKAEEGEAVTIGGTFTDVGALDTHTVTIDWGDGFVAPATVTQGPGAGTFTSDHAYAAGGVYTVTVTLTDDDTGSTSATTQAVVTGVGVNNGVLQIVGTPGRDHVEVFLAGGEIRVFAGFVSPKHRRFDPAAIDSIEIWLCAGNDHADVHPSISIDAAIHGDAGHDMLWGGSGDDFIAGGPGNDKIWGGRGDDVLHGDDGNDWIRGGKGLNSIDGGPGIDFVKQ